MNHLEESSGGPELIMATLPRSQQIVFLEMNSRLHEDNLSAVMDRAVAGCTDVFNVLDTAVRDHVGETAAATCGEGAWGMWGWGEWGKLWHIRHHREVIGGGNRRDKGTFCCGESGCREKMCAFGFLFPGKQNTLAALGGQGKSRYDSKVWLYYKQRSTKIMCSVPVMYQFSGTPLFRLPLESWSRQKGSLWSRFMDLEIQWLH